MQMNSRRACAPGIVALVALAAGCGGRLPPAIDTEVARTSLTAALDTWKEGKSAESLRDRSPPIDFRDTNWESGHQLTRYSILSEQRNGQSVTFSVQLDLEKGGASRKRTVVYQADAGKSVVIRPEF